MASPTPTSRHAADRIWLASASVFLACTLVFIASPIRWVYDSQYSMLLSEQLVRHGSFDLRPYFPQDPVDPEHFPGTAAGAALPAYIETVTDSTGISRLYYRHPPGTSVLSAPAVGLLTLVGYSSVDANGLYDQSGEIAIQSVLAPVLMASLCAVAVLLAHQLLPVWPSIMVGLSLGFGTQVWSTASRSLWSHSWLIMLHALAVLLLLRDATGTRRVNGWLLGSLMAWSYFVRPSAAIAIAGIALYLLVTRRRAFIGYTVAGVAWFGGFVAYSWTHFGTTLPGYFQVSWFLQSYGAPGGAAPSAGLADGGGSVLGTLTDMLTGTVVTGVVGSLISPSRGLLVFTPLVGFVVYLAIRHARTLRAPWLACLAAGIATAEWLLVATNLNWTGGHSYGPRMTTDLLPWVLVLAVLGLEAQYRRRPGGTWFLAPADRIVAAVALVIGVALHSQGATEFNTAMWNGVPDNINDNQSRLWDWKRPQFLAGFRRD